MPWRYAGLPLNPLNPGVEKEFVSLNTGPDK